MKSRLIHIIIFLLSVSAAFAQGEMRTIDSLKQAVASQSGREKVETMLELSWNLTDISFEEGVAAGDQSAAIAHESNYSDLEAKSYYRNGYLFLYHNDLDLSKEYLHKSLKLYKQLDDKVFLFEVYWCLALGDMRMGDLDSAAYYYDKAIDMAEATGDKVAKIDALDNLGMVYYEQGNWDDARKCYEDGYQIAKEEGDSLLMARNEFNLSVLYSELGEWQNSMPIYSRLIPFFSRVKDYPSLTVANKNMGLIYEKYYINYDSALFYFNRAVELADSIGSGWLLSESMNEIGNVLSLQGQYEEAMKKFDESLTIAQASSYPMGQIAALAGLGEVHYNKGDYSRSLDCFLQCRELSERYSIGIYNTIIRSALIRNYASLDRIEKLDEELNAFIENYESLSFQNAGFVDENNNIFKNVSDISRQYDELLAKSDRQNRQMRSYRLAFFGLLAIVFSVLSVLLLRHLRKKR